VFIVGLPRTGTTYLHRMLALDTERFTVFRLWELLFAPAICERKVLMAIERLDRQVGGPCRRLLGVIERLVLRRINKVHGTSLDAPEEDYLLLTPISGCFILILLFPFKAFWRIARFDAALSEGERTRVLRHYARCLQRHLYVHGPEKRILSKNPAFSPMIGSLCETFPDAEFIATFRHPVQAVPSLVSSMMEGADILASAELDESFRENLLEVLEHWMECLLERLPELPEHKRAFLTYEAVQEDTEATVEALYEHFTWEQSEHFRAVLAEECRAGRRFVSDHRYTPATVNMTEESIRRRFAKIFDRFGYKSNAAEVAR
jgi:hypothetical protein